MATDPATSSAHAEDGVPGISSSNTMATDPATSSAESPASASPPSAPASASSKTYQHSSKTNFASWRELEGRQTQLEQQGKLLGGFVTQLEVLGDQRLAAVAAFVEKSRSEDVHDHPIQTATVGEIVAGVNVLTLEEREALLGGRGPVRGAGETSTGSGGGARAELRQGGAAPGEDGASDEDGGSGEEESGEDEGATPGDEALGGAGMEQSLAAVPEEYAEEVLNRRWQRLLAYQVPYWVRLGTPVGEFGMCSCYFSRARNLSDADLDAEFLDMLKTVRKTNFAVLLLRSGRFSGAIFDGASGATVKHKNFSRYTTRAKQGGSQSAKDNTGKSIKSAGSSLRRYGEQQLENDLKTLFDQWSEQLCRCHAVFVSAGHAQLQVMTKQLPETVKTKKIPFPFKKPTLAEVEMLARQLRSVHLFEPEVFAAAREASGVAAEGGTPAGEASPAKKKSKAEEESSVPLLPEYDEEKDPLFTALHRAARDGDAESVERLIDESAAASTSSASPAQEAAQKLQDTTAGAPVPDAGERTTPPLDPITARDGKGRVAYYLAANTKTREAFRRGRGRFPDRFDWIQGQVPEALTTESEESKKEKEREKRRRQKERQKENKGKRAAEAEEQRKKEEEEKRRDEELERGPPCAFCGKGCGPDGNKWFRRLEYVYDKTECVRAHQRQLAADAAAKRFG